MSHVLLYLDLDQFKVVNDTCGHQAGDRLLKQLTSVVQTRIRTTDTLARLGGDEFGVLLQDCTLEDRAADRREPPTGHPGFPLRVAGPGDERRRVHRARGDHGALGIAGGRHERRGRRLLLGKGLRPKPRADLSTGASSRAASRDAVGVAHQSRLRGGPPAARLPADRADPRRRREAAALRAAAPHEGRERGAGTALGVHPAAERFNLMPALDRWVVRQACTRHVHRRGDTGRAPFILAINVSATTLNDEQFLDFVLAEMAAADVSPGALCFEMTETAAMSSLANAKHFVRELRERGCRFALDDFGSGLSSFIFLKNLPVDFLKIDGQFMHNVAHDRVDRGLVEAIAQIGQTMGIRTIAERVDSAEVLTRLADIGIEYAQGHYIAAPQPVEALETLIAREPDVIRRTA